MSIPGPTRAECEALTHRGAFYVKDFDLLKEIVVAYLAQSDENEALAKALASLLPYREHRPGCEVHQTDFCNCGMALAAAYASAALAEYAKRKQEGG